MKIAISGSQCVGKTTLLNAIENNLTSFKGYNLLREIVRTLMNQGVKINKGADHNSQMRILEAHYKNILTYPKFITDRCAVDAFVYATWDYIQGHYTYQEHKQHEEVFLSCIQSYDLFFYLPVEFPLQKDGVRSEDIEYRKQIDKLFLVIYDRYGIQFTALTGDVPERIQNFSDVVKLCS
jgi:nicotinamide riboside kinase